MVHIFVNFKRKTLVWLLYHPEENEKCVQVTLAFLRGRDSVDYAAVIKKKYIYIGVCVCTYTHVYIYIYVEHKDFFECISVTKFKK